MNIFVLEDDANIRKLLSFALNREGYQVREFMEANALYLALREKDIPDLLLLDIMLPGDDGFTVLKRLRENDKIRNFPVIMLTARNSEIDKLQGLNGGADDYVTKPFSIAELMARIRVVLRRVAEVDNRQKILKIGNLSIDDDRHTVWVDGNVVLLSKKEYDLLLLLMKANGKVCAREVLMSQVWGENYGESRTLDVHIRKLRQKLLSAGNLIQTVKGTGYRMLEADYEKKDI